MAFPILKITFFCLGAFLGRELLRAAFSCAEVHLPSPSSRVSWGLDADRPRSVPFSCRGWLMGPCCVVSDSSGCLHRPPSSTSTRFPPSRAGPACAFLKVRAWLRADPELLSGSRAAPPAPGQACSTCRARRKRSSWSCSGLCAGRSVAGRVGPVGNWRMTSVDSERFF